MRTIHENFDVVVVGGGLSGMLAAIAAAREGSKTVLVHNRPVLGGNASSEIRMHICGADCHSGRANARETGILEEILLEHKRRNPESAYPIFDAIMWEKVAFQENLTLHLNAYMYAAEAKNGKVTEIRVQQMNTEKEFVITGKIFVDATGDAMLADLVGADATIGRESKDTYGEAHAPDVADHYTMGNSLMFKAVDKGHPVPFICPPWAYHYTEEDLRRRGHKAIDSGYWWIELGGSKLSTIDDNEELRDELLKTVYGMWDHIKNVGDHGAENLELEWVGFLPSKRESRRVLGDYVLKEQDCMDCVRFEDTVAYGGWPMDVHVIDGFVNKSEEANVNLRMPDVYTIPYRCFYSRNVENLMMAGRNISASHLAFASTRVMATCAVGGQAVGVAAAMAVKKDITPRQVGEHIHELQQKLLRQDCYLPGIPKAIDNDLARNATVTASSYVEGAEPANVINGMDRIVGDDLNCWESACSKEAWLKLDLGKTASVGSVQVIFDSNLTKQITISISSWVLASEEKSTPSTLVSDIELVCTKAGQVVHSQKVEGNYVRNWEVKFDQAVECDSIQLNILKTHGVETAKVFGVSIYEA